MATIDVLAPSNWEENYCGATNFTTLGDVGWDGSAYVSHGGVQLVKLYDNGITNTLGIRITQCTFTMTLSGTTTPQIRIKDTDGTELCDETVGSSGTVDLDAYNETASDIGTIEFEYEDGAIDLLTTGDYGSWESFPYSNPSTYEPIYNLTLSSLILVYGPTTPPYIWQDYHNTIEIP